MSAAYIAGSLDERKAVARMIVYMGARAAYGYATLPWWAFYRRLRYRWLMTCYVQLVKPIEQGEHHDEQAKWMIDVDGGKWIDQSIVSTVQGEAAQPSKGE